MLMAVGGMLAANAAGDVRSFGAIGDGVATMENVRFDGCDLVCGSAEGADPGELKFFQMN